MALRKLNKSEIDALANKIKREIIEANEKAKEEYLLGMKGTMNVLKGNIMNNLGSLSELTMECLNSATLYNVTLDEDYVDNFLRNRALDKFTTPYYDFEDNWRGTDKIKESIILAQMGAEDIDGLIEAVTKQFEKE